MIMYKVAKDIVDISRQHRLDYERIYIGVV